MSRFRGTNEGFKSCQKDKRELGGRTFWAHWRYLSDLVFSEDSNRT